MKNQIHSFINKIILKNILNFDQFLVFNKNLNLNLFNLFIFL